MHLARLRVLLVAAPIALATTAAPQQPTPTPGPSVGPPATADDVLPLAATDSPMLEMPKVSDDLLPRLERAALEGRMPSYDDLRLEGDAFFVAQEMYLKTLPMLDEETATQDLLFPDIPEDSPYQALALQDLVGVALEGNFGLVNSRRDVIIARSETTASEAFFLPFLDVVGEARRTETREVDQPDPLRVEEGKLTDQVNRVDRGTGGFEATQNLATGGALTGTLTEGVTATKDTIGDTTTRGDTPYDARAEVRYLQPLLRGSSLPGMLGGDGNLVGTADQRRANLSEMNEILADKLRQRDTVQQVIRQYFNLLQIKQQLMVSRDAVRERWRFLNETRIKQQAGRVAESEILRAEIQFLQEIETAIRRRQSLDDGRDSLLVLLSLPLDTPISLVDVTPALISRGRFELPDLREAQMVAATNRIELMQSDIRLELDRISQAVSRNDLLPQLDVDGGLVRRETQDDFGDAQTMDNEVWDAGVTLRIPIQQIARREAYRQARIRREQTLTDRLALELSITQEVASAYRSLLTTEARLTVLSKQVEQARRNLELINESFQEGFSTITEVRLAQDDAFNAETSFSNAVLDYQTSIAELYVAMGMPLN